MKSQKSTTDTKPDFYAAFKESVQDQFDKLKNPKGYVMFGPSVNSQVMPKTLQYLPKFVTFQDLNYCQFGGNKQFKQIIAEGTDYNHEHTLSATNIEGAIDSFCLQFSTVSFEGFHQPYNQMKFLEYSRAKIVSQKQSKCHFVYINSEISKKKLIHFQKSQKTTVLIFSNKKYLRKIQNLNIYMLYKYQICGQSISCAVTHNSNLQNLQKLSKYFNQHYISTLTQAIIISKTKNVKFKQQHNSQNQLKKSIIKKIQLTNTKSKIKKENILIFQGATGALSFLAGALFSNGDNIAFDVPCYPGIQHDFQTRVSLKFSYNDLSKGRLINRVKKAKKNGSQAYVIVNPNNPTGYVYAEDQIKQICEWAIVNQDFLLIFDQMYINLIYGNANSISAVSYSVISPNIITIQGFAKDYGLCGFKIGYLVHSNKMLNQSFNRWKQILLPPKYSLQVIDKMLKKSKFGHQIIQYSKFIVKQSMQFTMRILDQYNIPYFKPTGGCFVWINLSKHLSENKRLNQNLLFSKIFYGYKLNIICGKAFNCPTEGFVRLCTVTDKQIILQGLQRLNRMINDNFKVTSKQNLNSGRLQKTKKIKKKQKFVNLPVLTSINMKKKNFKKSPSKRLRLKWDKSLC